MNPSGEKAKVPEKTKALCVATRCATIEQFVATFHRFCDESSFFVATLASRPVGLETAFSIQLEDKTPVLRGLCVVVEAWSTPANRFGRPGVRLNVRRLTNESLPVFKQLQAARLAAEAAEKANATPVAAATIESKPTIAPKPEPIAATPAPIAPKPEPIAATPAPIAATSGPIGAQASAPETKPEPIASSSTRKPEAIAAKPPDKPKTLADKLAEIKSQPKPPAIPQRKTDGIPPIPLAPPLPSALPKINPTAFAVKPAPARPATRTPPIIVGIGEPTKIEAKTVRAEGTAPVTRAEPPTLNGGIERNSIAKAGATGVDAKGVDAKGVDAKDVDAKDVDATGVDAKGVDATGADAKGVDDSAKGVDAKDVDAKAAEEATTTGSAPINEHATSSNAATPNAATSNAAASSNAATSSNAVTPNAATSSNAATPNAATSSNAATANAATSSAETTNAPSYATSAPAVAPSRPTPPPRAANVTTPAIGISTSTLNLSNAAHTAQDAHAQWQSPSDDTASIVDSPAGMESRAGANPAAPEAIAASDDMTSPVASESRAPGSSFILPANPLMNLSDKSLEGFVDCALYEETGNFFRAPGYEDSLVDIDEVAQPPGDLAPAQAIRPGDEVSQAAYVITPTPAYGAQQQDMTPVPVTGRNPTQPPYPTGQMAPMHPYATGQTAPLQYPTGQMPAMQHPTGPMAPMQYATGQMAPLQYATGQMQQPSMQTGQLEPMQYATGQMPSMQQPSMQTGQLPSMQYATANAPYGMMQGPHDSTAALLATSATNRRRWMIIGGAALFASLVLLVIVIATRGGDRTATAATTPPAAETMQPNEEKVTMAVTPPPANGVQTEAIATPTQKAPVEVPDDEENAPPSDPNAPPVVGSGPCKLTVTSTPAGSMVRLDDQVMGPSPITIQSACARKRVDVRHPRYAPGMKWVNLAVEKPASVDISLNRPTHTVTIVTQPAGATISIAGRRAGTSPTRVQLMGFTKVALTIEKKGYKTVVESIYSKRDRERRTVTLTRGR